MKPILLVLLAVLLAPLARADTITTTETVGVSVGCWNPAVCGDPAAFWNALDLPVPAIEPPAADFVPIGDPPLFIFTYDAADGEMIATPVDSVTTPEPSAALLFGTGLLVLIIIRKRLAIALLLLALPMVANELPSAPPPRVAADVPRQKTADKKFWVVTGILGAAAAADHFTTSQHLDTPWFHETDPLYGIHPTNARLASVGACFYGGQVAVAYILKKYGEHHRWAKHLWAIEPLAMAGIHAQSAAHNASETIEPH
jgi:hypothetical protein